MLRFIIGFIGTCALLTLALVAGIAWSVLKDGTDAQGASMLFTLGMGFLIPAFAVLGTIGGVLWMWRSPAGRFSGRIDYATKQQGNNFKSWIYGNTCIGGKNAGTAVLSDALNNLWQETKNHGHPAEFFKMGRAIVAIRSPEGTRQDWGLQTMRAAYPITTNVMLFGILLGGAGLLWLVPVYLWGAFRANRLVSFASATAYPPTKAAA